MEEYLRYLTERFSGDFGQILDVPELHNDQTVSAATTPPSPPIDPRLLAPAAMATSSSTSEDTLPPTAPVTTAMASAQPLPAIVLVAGMCSVGTVVYGPLIKQLRAQGFDKVTAIDLPSTDAVAENDHAAAVSEREHDNEQTRPKYSLAHSLKPNGLEADMAAIRTTLADLIDGRGRDVVVIGHSYGGTPALHACEGLWKAQRRCEPRSDDAKEGGDAACTMGVLRVGLISSSLTLPGETVAGCRARFGIYDGDGARIEKVDEVSISLYVLNKSHCLPRRCVDFLDCFPACCDQTMSYCISPIAHL